MREQPPNEFSRVRRRVLWIGSTIAGAMLCALAWSIALAITQHADAGRALERSHRVVTHLDAMRDSLQAAEAGQRGYLVAGRDEYLVAYDHFVTALPATLASLAALTRDDPGQQTRLRQLQSGCDDLVLRMNETIRLRRERGLDAAITEVLKDDGWRATERVRGLLSAMRVEEDRMLERRRLADQAVTAVLNDMIAVLFALAAALSLALICLVTHMRRLQSGLVTVCAWTRRVQYDGKWIPIEQYLAHRFGLRISHGMSQEAADACLARLDGAVGAPDSQR